MILDLEWWHLCFVAVMVFLTLLFTNYVIKKINEARIEERYASLTERNASNQGTQIQAIGKILEPTAKNPPSAPENGTKLNISLIFDKDDNNQQDRRIINATIQKKVRPEVLTDIEEVVKIEDTTSTNPNKQASSITSTVMGSIIIKDSNDLVQGTTAFPITEIVSHNAKETLPQNTESVESKLTHPFERNVIEDNNISYNNNMDIEGIGLSNIELQKPNTSVLVENTVTTQSHNVIPQLTKEMMVQETITLNKNTIDKSISTILNTEFLKSHIPVAKVSQKTSNSSLIIRNSNVKATNTLENLEDCNKDDGSPSTTVGLVMLKVCQKAEKSFFHNTNKLGSDSQNFIKTVSNISAKTEVANEMNETPLQPSQSSNYSLDDNSLQPKSPETKGNILARDLMVTITSTVSDPQASKRMKKTENTLSHKSSNTSRIRYHRKLKNFWDVFYKSQPR